MMTTPRPRLIRVWKHHEPILVEFASALCALLFGWKMLRAPWDVINAIPAWDFIPSYHWQLGIGAGVLVVGILRLLASLSGLRLARTIAALVNGSCWIFIFQLAHGADDWTPGSVAYLVFSVMDTYCFANIAARRIRETHGKD